MGKALTPQHLKELAALRDRCVFIYDFMTKHAPLGPLATQLRDAVKDAHAAQNLRGLRLIRRDFDEWSKSLPETLREELGRLLNSRFGVDQEREAEAREREVSEILARGRIRNEREYRLVESSVDDLVERRGSDREISLRNELLSRYPD
jgi:hypothetical protein